MGRYYTETLMVNGGSEFNHQLHLNDLVQNHLTIPITSIKKM